METATVAKKDFPCEKCGASLTFKPGSDHIVCEYCGHSQPVPVSLTEKKEIKEYSLEEGMALAKKVKAKDVTNSGKEISCKNCGAVSIVTNQSDRCAFCGSPMVVEVGGDEEVFVPESVLPFKITKQESKNMFMEWVKGLWFAPNDLKKRATSSGMDGVYLPYWTYDSDTKTAYTGQRGEYYYETEFYQDSNGNQQSRQVQKTHWYSASGSVTVNFDDVLICASKSLPKDLIEELEPWDLNELMNYDSAYLSGFITERYKVGLEEGYSSFKEKIVPEIHSAIKSDIGGDTQMIHSTSTTYSAVKFKHLLLPVWISSYSYGDKVYRFMVNARTGEVVGHRPWSWVKITLAALSVLSVIGLYFYFGTK
jgi:hypothetical protein